MAAPVLVVGAGPAGLLLAAELHRRGVSCLLIDSQSGPMPWDRATVIHQRSLELFESLGLIGRFVDAGCPQRGAKISSAGVVLGEVDDALSGSRYAYNIGVSEEVTEAILTDYLHAMGGAVTRSTRLVAFTEGPDGVVAELECTGERSNVEVDWVVGCDGIHSTARESSGIAYDGHDIPDPWAVFDVTLQGWRERYDLTFVYLDAAPVILTALPGQRWRAYVRPRAADADLVADAAATLGPYAPDASFVDIANPTRFHCHTRVAARFRSGRVLVAGDAAHACTPAEGHGMNTGLQDAANLAWKLALVGHGVADPKLLDSYEAERRPVAQTVARSGDATDAASTLSDPTARHARDEALIVALADPVARHHDAVAKAELDVDYGDSPAVVGDRNARLGPGQRLPDTITVEPPGGDPCGLHELAQRAGHTLFVLAGTAASGPALAEHLDELEAAAAGSPLVDAVVALGCAPDQPDRFGRLDAVDAAALGVDGVAVLVVRPDGYLGLRADRDHVDALARYHEALGVRPPLAT